MALSSARAASMISAISSRADGIAPDPAFERAVEVARAGRNPTNGQGIVAPVNALNREGDVTYVNGYLSIETGDDSDDVQLEQDPSTGEITLMVNGKKYKYSDVINISVHTNGGKDRVTTPGTSMYNDLWPFNLFGNSGPPLDVFTSVDAGAGNDIVDLSAASHNTLIVGGEGQDVLVGGQAGCDADFREDVIFGDAPDDIREADTIVTRADTSNHLTITDATWDSKDKLIEFPAGSASCTSNSEENVDPKV